MENKPFIDLVIAEKALLSLGVISIGIVGLHIFANLVQSLVSRRNITMQDVLRRGKIPHVSRIR